MQEQLPLAEEEARVVQARLEFTGVFELDAKEAINVLHQTERLHRHREAHCTDLRERLAEAELIVCMCVCVCVLRLPACSFAQQWLRLVRQGTVWVV